MSDHESTPETDFTLLDRVREIDDLLESTAELPLDRAANRWIGEAHAVTRDLVDGEPDESTIRRRVGHVVHLLETVDGTDHQATDEAVTDALEVARAIAADGQ